MQKNISKIENSVLLLYTIIIKFFMSMYSVRFSEVFTDNDGAIYYTIGKAIMKGRVLYKDIFDHKTPYVYFINALASILEKNHLGLFIVEILLLFLSIFYMYKFLNIFISKYRSLIGAFLLGILLNIPQITFSYSRTEEYAIAFMIVALYLFTKYFFYNNCKSYEIIDSNCHNDNLSGEIEMKEFICPMIIIGILAGLTFMTNIRAIILFVPFAISLFLKFIKQKRVVYIIKLFLAGLLGVFLSILPYLIYMIVTNSVNDAIYAIFTFNFNYLGSSIAKGNILEEIIAPYYGFYILIILSIIALIKTNFDNYLKMPIITSLILAFIYTVVLNRPSVYYFVLFMPFFLAIYIFTLEIFDSYCKITKKKMLKEKDVSNNIVNNGFEIFSTKLRNVIILFFVFIVFGILISYNDLLVRCKNCVFRSSKINNIIESEFKNKQNIDILSLGFMPEVYIFTNTIPKYKYFIIPNVTYKKDKTPYLAQYNYVATTDPDLIVFSSKGFYDLYPTAQLDHINYVLTNDYSLEDTIRTNEFEGDIYIFVKKANNVD